jgi:hypothetical protein
MVNPPLATRRSTRSPSSPLFIGMAVHKDASAVAYGAPEHGAEVMDLGASSMRPGAIDPMIRQRQSQATPLSCVDEAGPWGPWGPGPPPMAR